MAETQSSFKKHLTWKAPEFEYHEKGKLWFIIGGSIVVLLVLYALLSKNILFLLIIAFAVFSVLSYSFKKPRILRFVITSRGIKIGKTMYNFEYLKSFWIFESPIEELSLRSKKSFMPYIYIPLENQDVNEVSEILEQYLPKREQERPLIDNFIRMLKF